jgi:hypothetical protein
VDRFAKVRFPVFILGSPRSGTSILVDALLTAGMHGFREGHFLSLIAPIEAALLRHFRRPMAANAMTLLGNVKEDETRRRLFAELKDMADSRHRGPWLDKTGDPDMINSAPFLLDLWPDSVFIFARRRAIENMVSRLKKFPQHPFERHCVGWAKNMAAWRAVREKLPPQRYIEIDQQEMIVSPAAVADRLASFVGMDEISRAAIDRTFRHSRPQQTEEGTAARRMSLESAGWSQADVAIFMQQCGPEMEAYGYSLDGSYFRDAPLPAVG